ncbi:hypothetical protein ALI44B_04555 [Leifsonia sp. ALI-44-B]|uniref:hypothetical protein n=1 Tax=Leifsonia sp. ALI-44-B TaxID=1933776 RepID=UPI00097BB971|nr:hypothetical protein [Leifsonia sp. ALI-44-B]ONI63901.1 hypothetical protein ALI44B_04555 [Leifsonia sp. ALI-44-B]
MGQTLNRKYPYPPGTVVPNVPYDLQLALDQIDADVNKVLADTGWLDIPLSSGWTPTSVGARYRRKGGTVHLQLSFDPKTFAQFAVIGTLPPGFRPSELIGTWYLVGVYSSSAIEIQILANGQIRTAGPGTNFGVKGSTSFPID